MKREGEVLRLSATDLSTGQACGHASELDLQVAQGTLDLPRYRDPALDALWAQGQAHEAAYLARLRAEGLIVQEVNSDGGAESAVEQTRRFMREGAQAIYQAHLQHDRWVGRADFLMRVDAPSAAGGFGYEAVDTKLAVETRAGTILQLCLYSELISLIQGSMPVHMRVVTPVERIDYRVADYDAYYRLARKSLVSRLEQATESYPEPVDHCDVCRWWSRCDKRRHDDDHLSLVAGISRSQRADLVEHDVRSLQAFAEALPIKPRRGSRQSLERVQKQAQVQLRGRLMKTVLHELIAPVEPKRGLNLLPEPNPGDVFLDLEGDPFVGRDGLEYLFGWGTMDGGAWRYTPIWSHDAAEEKSAFDKLMLEIAARRSEHSGLHIYHYHHYEPSALKRLASRYAIHVDLLDELLRGERFVDLYRVVRQGVRASVERYSIKELEPLYGFGRQVALREVSSHKRGVEGLLQLARRDLPADSKRVVEQYNEDDCRSALALRDWLEGERTKLVAAGEPIERPTLAAVEASENVTEWLARIQPLQAALLDGLPEDPDERRKQGVLEGLWLLAHLLQWHRRELNCSYWDLYRLRDLDAEDLRDEPTAIAGLRFDQEIDKAKYNPKLKSAIYRYRFDEQHAQLREGDKLRTTGDAKNAGEILGIDHAAGWVDIKVANAASAEVIEAATGVYKFKIVDAKPMERSLERIAAKAVGDDKDISRSSPLAAKLLHRIAPAALPLSLNRSWDAVIHLDGDVLPVQGPPGSGKSYSGARMILALHRQGKKVGVCATSHAVIENLMRAVVKAAQEDGVLVPRMIRGDDEKGDEYIAVRSSKAAVAALKANEYDVLGGTAWLWSSEDAEQIVDTLFIDEAGQMSLANAVACTPATRNLVLLGDPQQLAQPTKASHPEGTEVSVLAHCLGDQQTISADRGLFLDDTYRLHPKICDLISTLYYEGRLGSARDRDRQRIDGVFGLNGCGLRLELVEHRGNSNRSDDEVARVAALHARFLASGRFTDHEGNERALALDDILIVAPYNAQVDALRDAMPAAKIGTVDKFQGQEAPVVIYSMTTSSVEDAPRGMDFLYDPHRLNVAISRARALAVIVASPALLEPTVRSPKQMKLANALARFAELAAQHSADA